MLVATYFRSQLDKYGALGWLLQYQAIFVAMVDSYGHAEVKIWCVKIFSPIASEESHIIFFILSLLEANAGLPSVSIHC